MQRFKDNVEKEMVLYAIQLSLTDDFTKELCGVLPKYLEFKIYKEVRDAPKLSDYEEAIGDIYKGVLNARAFLRKIE